MVQPSSKEKGKRVEANPDAINVDDNDSVESGEAPDIAINDKAEKDASHDAKGTKRPREVDEYGDNGCSVAVVKMKLDRHHHTLVLLHHNANASYIHIPYKV